jgi:branched-chain amino acid transport system substrate-binding protein
MFKLAAALALCVIISAPCSAQKSADSIKVGAVYGFSGFASVWSEQARRGIEMAVDEINQSGGVNGRELEMFYEDSRSTSAGAVTAFKNLLKVAHVEAVVGDILSFLTLPLVPLADKYRIVLITPSIFDSDLPADSEYLFTTCPRRNSIKAPVDRFFQFNPDVRAVAVICADNSWGLTYLDVWKQSARQHNAKIVDANCLDEFSTDMRAEVLRAKSKRPDAVVVAFGVDRALRRMREIGFAPKILSTSDVMEALQTRGLSREQAEGVYFNDWLASPQFKQRFQSRYQQPAIMEPQNSYEAVRSIAEAYRRSPGDLLAGMRQVKYEGVAGKIDFTRSRAGNMGEGTLLQVKKGQVVTVR